MAGLPLHLEITPPRAPQPRLLLRRASCLDGRARRIHVIERRGRWSSLEASGVLAAAGIEPVWHLTSRGRGVREIESDLARAALLGIRRVLCVRGESKLEDRDDTPKLRELVALVRRALPAATVAVSFDPFASAAPAARARAVRNLDAKLRAGARVVQSQLSFELESLRPFAEWARAVHPDVEIWPMLMPVESARAALALSRRLRVPLPAALVDRLERLGADAGWEHFSCFARAVAESPLFDGLTVMTPIDPAPGYAARLRAATEL